MQIAVAAVQAERILRTEHDRPGGAAADDVFPEQFGLLVFFDQGHEAVLVLEEDAAGGIDGRRVAKRNGLLFGKQVLRERPDQALGTRPLGPGRRFRRGGDGRGGAAATRRLLRRRASSGFAGEDFRTAKALRAEGRGSAACGRRGSAGLPADADAVAAARQRLRAIRLPADGGATGPMAAGSRR